MFRGLTKNQASIQFWEFSYEEHVHGEFIPEGFSNLLTLDKILYMSILCSVFTPKKPCKDKQVQTMDGRVKSQTCQWQSAWLKPFQMTYRVCLNVLKVSEDLMEK